MHIPFSLQASLKKVGSGALQAAVWTFLTMEEWILALPYNSIADIFPSLRLPLSWPFQPTFGQTLRCFFHTCHLFASGMTCLNLLLWESQGGGCRLGSDHRPKVPVAFLRFPVWTTENSNSFVSNRDSIVRGQISDVHVLVTSWPLLRSRIVLALIRITMGILKCMRLGWMGQGQGPEVGWRVEGGRAHTEGKYS